MSNLIKSVYFNVNPQEKRVIDSDSHVEEYIPEIYAQETEAKPFEFAELSPKEDAEFRGGIPVIRMDDVLEKERQKISQETEAQSQEILSAAQAEADAILEQARAEAEGIAEQAAAEGREAGRREGLKLAEEQLQEKERCLQEEYQKKMQELETQAKQMEPFFADLVVSLIEKITGIVCQDKKEVILYLMDNALHNLEKTKQITLRVSKEDMAVVSMKKAQLKESAGDVEEFDIVEDSSLSANQCIIETENKIIDCSLDAQLKSLEEQIKMLVI